jgi:uncharacterized protein YecT (DUF1311 family)
MAEVNARIAGVIVCMALAGSPALTEHAARARQDAPGPSVCPPTLHCAKVPADRFAWLAKLKGASSSRDAVLSDEFPRLLAAIVPGANYHFHVDMPLVNAFTTIIRGAAQPIGVRDGRYMTLAACVSPNCVGARAMLWIDIDGGLSIGAIDFNPSNGEPTPTETLFSTQILDPVTDAPQLPATFLTDLAVWSHASRTRAPVARYFINGRGLKTVVPHNEDSCASERAMLPPSLCAAMNAETADQDMQAAFYLLVNSYANGTPSRTAAEADQGKWLRDRQAACGAGANTEALACRRTYARDRVRALTTQYMKPGS